MDRNSSYLYVNCPEKKEIEYGSTGMVEPTIFVQAEPNHSSLNLNQLIRAVPKSSYFDIP